MKKVGVAALSLVGVLLSACTGEELVRQSYDLSSGWKVQECRRKIDPVERDHCLSSARLSYNEFQALH